MRVKQTPTFAKCVKKLFKNQRDDLDDAIEKILQEPSLGELKKGDLRGV